ncbi:MAG: hypothetical protein V4609_18850 [Pseudomonadota bacterium]
MNRWTPALFAPLLLAAASAFSQSIVREAPANVRPARMVVTQPPEVTLNGTPDRLSPGARIRDLNNLAVLSGSLVGQNLPMVYRRDAAGLVHEVWLLTEGEYAQVRDYADNTANPEAVAKIHALLIAIFGGRR